MVKTSMPHEDYLEAIVMLGGTTDAPVRSVDVANKLGVSKASVNKAISALKEQELVVPTALRRHHADRGGLRLRPVGARPPIACSSTF